MTSSRWEPGAGIANALWWGRGQWSAARLASALRDPREAQWQWLRRRLRTHRASEYGQRHDFAAIRSAAEFAQRVPMVGYDALAADIDRVRRGVPAVLTATPVTHLAPTSGSTGARKLIPFTADLQRSFGQAVDAWWSDLVRQRPGLLGGPSYWSVSPLEEPETAAEEGSVPVGFQDDAEYLGGTAARLVRRALAVPSAVRHLREMEAFWGLTLVALLRRRALRMLSVWHPSFIALLVEQAERLWDPVLEAVASGEPPAWTAALPASARAMWRAAPAAARAAELRRIGAARWPAWWPQLAVISAWGDQAAAPGLARLRTEAPRVLVQAKGLLATEGVVTLPFAGTYPLAVRSHFHEFLDAAGEIRGAQELQRGAQYEVVLTNGGGLWRCRLGDVVECTGHLAATPTLRFLGRAGRGSDLRGEKLSEVFVAEVLRGLWPDGSPPLALLRARDDGVDAGYELLVSADEAEDAPALAQRADAALSANPHYALARRLGQLAPLRVLRVAGDDATRRLAASAGRLGDAKPQLLVTADEAVAP